MRFTKKQIKTGIISLVIAALLINPYTWRLFSYADIPEGYISNIEVGTTLPAGKELHISKINGERIYGANGNSGNSTVFVFDGNNVNSTISSLNDTGFSDYTVMQYIAVEEDNDNNDDTNDSNNDNTNIPPSSESSGETTDTPSSSTPSEDINNSENDSENNNTNNNEDNNEINNENINNSDNETNDEVNNNASDTVTDNNETDNVLENQNSNDIQTVNDDIDKNIDINTATYEIVPREDNVEELYTKSLYINESKDLIYEIKTEKNNFVELKSIAKVSEVTIDGNEIILPENYSHESTTTIVSDVVKESNCGELNGWLTIKTPSNNKNGFLGYVVNEIVKNSNNTYTIVLKSTYENMSIVINYYTKANSINDNYALNVAPDNYNIGDSIKLKEVSDLSDAIFLGWDKVVPNSSAGTFELYAQYGRKTKITQQPTAASVTTLDTANFSVSATGDNLKYEWYIGEQGVDESAFAITYNNGFSASNGVYTSTNKSDNTKSLIKFKEFGVSKSSVLSFEYLASTEEDYDTGKIYLLDSNGNVYRELLINGINNSWVKYDFSVEPGTYVFAASYSKDGSGSEGSDSISVRNIKLNDVDVKSAFTGFSKGVLIGTNSSVSLNRSNPNFANGKLIKCVVYGDYGIVESNIVKLNVKAAGQELLGLRASYNGTAVAVGSEYVEKNLTVIAELMDYSVNKVVSKKITDYKIDSKVVNKIGENKFTVTYVDLTASFVVNGGSAPSKPLNVKINDTNSSKTVISWTAPESINGGKITHYLVYDAAGKATKCTNTSLSLKKFSPSTEYKYSVSAVNKFGESEKVVISYNTDKQATALTVEYAKESVLVGEKFDPKKVKVTLTYSDKTTRVIDYSELTKTPTSTKITTTGYNNFTVQYNKLKATLKIHGYDIAYISANYSGDDVLVGENINKEKVTVLVVYTKDISGNAKRENTKEFTLNNQKISYAGSNTFIAKFGGKTDTFTVTGYREGDTKIEESTIVPSETVEAEVTPVIKDIVIASPVDVSGIDSILESTNTEFANSTETTIAETEEEKEDVNIIPYVIFAIILIAIIILAIIYIKKKKEEDNDFNGYSYDDTEDYDENNENLDEILPEINNESDNTNDLNEE